MARRSVLCVFAVFGTGIAGISSASDVPGSSDVYMQGPVAYCTDLKPVRLPPLPSKAAVRDMAYAKALIELDHAEFPEACKARIDASKQELLWVRTRLRGKQWQEHADPMLDVLRPEDGQAVIYMTAIDSEMTVDAQLQLRGQVFAQGKEPRYLYALLHFRNGAYTLFPLNFSQSADPLQPDIRLRARQLEVAYDVARSEYLYYFKVILLLTPDWDPASPSWEQFYVWRFDARKEQIQRLLLPPGPWVSDAKLDGIKLRAFRNFACGVDCYRHVNITVNAGNVYATVTGESSAISGSVVGTYVLRLGETKWVKK